MLRSLFRYTLSHFQNPFLDPDTEEEFKQTYFARLETKVEHLQPYF